MNTIIIKTLLFCMIPLSSCLYEETEIKPGKTEEKVVEHQAHEYGGWYCPDNLNLFPPVDLENWKKVEAIEGRLANREEIAKGASLILVDTEKYPNAKALDVSLPQLAKYKNPYSKREDVMIIIQAININGDSIVGFRFLNGGNGSARLSEVDFITEAVARKLSKGKFTHLTLEIKASETLVWDLISNAKYRKDFQPTFDNENKMKGDWRKNTNVNFLYKLNNVLTNAFASDDFWGNCYIQNDYNLNNYSEKFFIFINKDTQQTNLEIVCGPFDSDYQQQNITITNWANRVKDLSEMQEAVLTCTFLKKLPTTYYS